MDCVKLKNLVNILLLALFFFPSLCFGWDAKTTAQIVNDATLFAPNRMRGVIKKNRAVLQMMAEASIERLKSGQKPQSTLAPAVQALKNFRQDPETAAQAIMDAAVFLLESSSLTNDPDFEQQITEAYCAHQAEFDGIQYINEIRGRMKIARFAAALSRRDFSNWATANAPQSLAAEAIATAYHVAVNDTADLMATLWRSATGDTANTASPGRRLPYRKNRANALWLPKGHDPVPKLADYYRQINSGYALKRLEKVKTTAPVPDGVYLFNFKGLKIITKDGQQLKTIWKKTHKDNSPIENDVAPVEPIEPIKPIEPVAAIDLETPPAPELPMASSGGTDLGQRKERRVVHSRLGPSQKRNGVLNEAAIEREITRHLPALRSCYERLSAGSDMTGTVTVNFIVVLDGSVGDVKVVQNTTGSFSLGQCIEDLLSTARFPSPQNDPVSIRYPFVFQ
jgi:hypothetical protein